MKPLHAGSNYRFLSPYIQKMKRTGQNEFKAGLGLSRLVVQDQGRTLREYGHVYRIGYADKPDQYYEIAVSDDNQTVTPLRYVDRKAVSLDNTVRPLTDVMCFWSWQNPCPKPAAVKMVDTMLWKWCDYLTHREYFNVKYA